MEDKHIEADNGWYALLKLWNHQETASILTASNIVQAFLACGEKEQNA